MNFDKLDDSEFSNVMKEYWGTDEYIPGGMDLLFLGDIELKRRIITILVARLELLPESILIKRVILLVPKSVVDRIPTPEIILDGMRNLASVPGSKINFDNFELELLLTTCISSDDALELLPQMDSSTLLLVVAAATFRKHGVELVNVQGVRFPEDYWLPHLLCFVQLMSELSQKTKANIIFDAGETVQFRTSYFEEFTAIPSLSILFNSKLSDDRNHMSQIEEWHSLLNEGKFSAVLKSIEQLPQEYDNRKPFMRTRIYYRAGLLAQAQIELENTKNYKELDSFECVLLAQIALGVGAGEYAKELLEFALPNLYYPEALELALELASSISNSSVEEKILCRLEGLVPKSLAAKKTRVLNAVKLGHYQQAYNLLDREQQESETGTVYLLLQSYLENQEQTPNYQELIEHLSQTEWKNFSQSICVRDALRRHLILHACTLTKAGQNGDKLSALDVRLIIDVLEKIMLLPGASDFTKDDSQTIAAVRTTISYLSLHPNDTISRHRFERLVSREVSGINGVALLTHFINVELAKPIETASVVSTPNLSVRELLDKESEFLNKGFEFLEKEHSVFLGDVRLPTEIVPDNPSRFEEAFHEIIRLCGLNKDLDSLGKYLSLGVGLAGHMGNPIAKFRLLFVAGKTLALAGKNQFARDIYECMLNTLDATSEQKRLAWLTMADVNCRSNNQELALLALGCSTMIRAPITLQDECEQVSLARRMFRDLGFFSIARTAVVSEKRLLRAMGEYEENFHRIDFANLQIDALELFHDKRNVEERVLDLISAVMENVQTTRKKNDLVAPTYVLLVNLIEFANKHDVPIPHEASGLVRDLRDNVEPALSEPANAIGDETINAQQLMELHCRYDISRFSADASNEPHGLTNAARKFISSDIQNLAPNEFAFAVELMTDRAMALPGWSISAKPLPPVASLNETEIFLAQISQEGIAIVMAALDVNGRLRSMFTNKGILGKVKVEDESVFSVNHFSNWKKSFPFKFGIDDGKNPNLFFDEMENLGLSIMPIGRTIVVFEADLQQIPVNLLWTDQGFAGKTRPISFVPSLSWLAYARCNPLKTSKATKAWIPTNGIAGGTLEILSELLGETLRDNNIDLVKTELLPHDFSGIQMSIVAAHGSLIPDYDSIFQRVSDETRFVAMAQDFADAFRNVGVVILFVCSAGRADSHPNKQTTIGLARTLLDKGCAAVVASPWPLNSMVPPAWLPPFLDAWKSGQKLIDACFEANKVVAERRGDDWAGCLAMTVYGDALRNIND